MEITLICGDCGAYDDTFKYLWLADFIKPKIGDTLLKFKKVSKNIFSRCSKYVLFWGTVGENLSGRWLMDGLTNSIRNVFTLLVKNYSLSALYLLVVIIKVLFLLHRKMVKQTQLTVPNFRKRCKPILDKRHSPQNKRPN